MFASTLISTPMNYSTKVSHDESEHLPHLIVYRHLIYFTNTRPDVIYVIHNLIQYFSTPTINHHHVAQHIIFYLKLTSEKGIFFDKHSNTYLKAFSDFNWASCPDIFRSITVTLEIIPSCGASRSKLLFSRVLLKLNTQLWLPPLVRYNGLPIF